MKTRGGRGSLVYPAEVRRPQHIRALQPFQYIARVETASQASPIPFSLWTAAQSQTHVSQGHPCFRSHFRHSTSSCSAAYAHASATSGTPCCCNHHRILMLPERAAATQGLPLASPCSCGHDEAPSTLRVELVPAVEQPSHNLHVPAADSFHAGLHVAVDALLIL